MKNIIIKIKGMGCQNCVNAVMESLSEIDGINKVNVSLEKELAEVEYDELKVNADKMIETIKELEYEASI
ncbi:heavy-metal-associated domain-containing protein [Brachyspira aalborgi]|jgi:copZ, copper chaperone|uniref:Heavy-metal-associated domain-containing protein n=1 Tax=Brachyspira aalborgi TaxID=29522 RepID=A0A5C8GAB3_9SPIR|nr:cation transporter [Brachyspira aalborgi]CCY74396.1 copZ Copper chaperone [Brachyspira sp. CAG:700]TXJ12658.1 heavy-metal-associated domain-containing protein [Brachyspira aalborgi]TXJ16764.1 heavy-metal-associated domain-containing protein [Brachyspira aalborgi]TXJ20280.1 heavy-metal-associated domain-containing protein [Brachyspira aalborgi]TXJ22167.1 heavy-metal-associated domain-containing protein [Brachyspira aalborgi]